MVASCWSSNDFKVFFQSKLLGFSLTWTSGLVSAWVLGAGVGAGSAFLTGAVSTGLAGADGAFSLIFELSTGTIGLVK